MLEFRFAGPEDVDLLFEWANDPDVRMNSYNQEPVSYDQHVAWYRERLSSGACFFYLFHDERNSPIGVVRIENKKTESVVSISVDKMFRGKGLSSEMLCLASDDYLEKFGGELNAYIKTTNISSNKAFLRAGYREAGTVTIKRESSFKLVKHG